ncbi:hypothetical protein AOLI_G00286120 [Acnodon oligacanthus]
MGPPPQTTGQPREEGVCVRSEGSWGMREFVANYLGQTAGKWLIAAEFKSRHKDMGSISAAIDEPLNQDEQGGST